MHRWIILVALALLAAACTLPGLSSDGDENTQVVTTTSTTTTAPASTTGPTDPPVDLDITDCERADEIFAALCTAYDVLTANFVDPLEPQVLATAAVNGIAVFDPDGDAGFNDPVTCAIPTNEFVELCEVIAEELATEATPIEVLVEAAILGMTEFGEDDPNSSYIPPSSLARLQEERTGSIEGIGALVRAIDNSGPEEELCTILSDSCKLVIVSPLDGSPAEAAGVRSGDAIVTVDGDDVRGQTIDQIVNIVRGPSGTDVVLGLEREGEVLVVTITRAPIVIPVVEHEMLDDNTGYVLLRLFSGAAGEQVREAINDLLDQGATDLILDLQSNPGGALNAAIDVASEFLGDGLVLITQAPGDDIEYRVRGDGLLTDPAFPVVVLVDRGSASASEVVTGALQEAGRVTVMGENTFGKNTVQQEFELPNGGALRVTIARWITPGGLDFGGDGLAPDIEIALTPDSDPDLLRDEALAYLNR